MYVPYQYSVSDFESWSIVRDVGAGFLVVATSHGLRSVFAPIVVSEDFSCVHGHVSRANPWWSLARDGDEVVCLFNAAHSYVSPNYYPSKAADPRVAPTWNYVSVEIAGRVTITDDPVSTESVVRRLTQQFESTQTHPWAVDDAPREFVTALVKGIVSFQIAVTSISASAKLSQNQPEQNIQSVKDTLAKGDARAQEVSRWMNERT